MVLLAVATIGCEGLEFDESLVVGPISVGQNDSDVGPDATACVPGCDGMAGGPDGCRGECGDDAHGPPATCVPNCLDSVCGDNGCGGSCGRCDVAFVCVDGACECASPGQQTCCGFGDDSMCWVDGCDGTKAIEKCPDGCVNGACCTPSCKGKVCGDDGCGGSCGQCEIKMACVHGACGCAASATSSCCEDDTAVCSYDSCGHLEEDVEVCALGCLDGSCCGPCAEGHHCSADGTCVCGELGTSCPEGFECEEGHCVGGEGDEVYVPSGAFIMGCTAAAGIDCLFRPDEMPRHTVTLQAFAIDRHEVSVVDYKQCVTTGGCSPPIISDGGVANYASGSKQTHPVNFVKWAHAAEFCDRQDKRLCSAAEWEMAGRGSCSHACAPGDFECCEAMMPVFPWGNWMPDCDTANHGSPSCVGDTTPVGSYPAGASPYGTLDMAGNVWEWVQDCWHEDYALSPTDGSPWEDGFGMCLSKKRVIRGGSYSYSAEQIRLAERFAANPKYGSGSIGFRCCRDLED